MLFFFGPTKKSSITPGKTNESKLLISNQICLNLIWHNQYMQVFSWTLLWLFVTNNSRIKTFQSSQIIRPFSMGNDWSYLKVLLMRGSRLNSGTHLPPLTLILFLVWNFSFIDSKFRQNVPLISSLWCLKSWIRMNLHSSEAAVSPSQPSKHRIQLYWSEQKGELALNWPSAAGAWMLMISFPWDAVAVGEHESVRAWKPQISEATFESLKQL